MNIYSGFPPLLCTVTAKKNIFYFYLVYIDSDTLFYVFLIFQLINFKLPEVRDDFHSYIEFFTETLTNSVPLP